MKRALLSAALILPLAASCSLLEDLSQGTLSEAEAQDLLVYQENIALLEKQIEGLESQAASVSAQALEEAKQGALEHMGFRLQHLLDIQEAHEEVVGKYVAEVAKEREMIDSAFDRATSGVLGVVGPFIPPGFQPLIPFLSSLAVLAFSTRARKHAGKALLAGAKGNLGQMLASVAKGVGWSHSNDTPSTVLAGAISVAKKGVANGTVPQAELDALLEAQKKMESA